MVDSRSIEETATLTKELSSGWAKDGRGHLREEAAHKRFNLQFFSTMISGLGYGPLSKGWSLNRQTIDGSSIVNAKEDTKVLFVAWCVGLDCVQ